MNQAPPSGLRRRVLVSLGASLLYGPWAYAVNSDFGWVPAARATLTQGVTSFLATMVMVSVLEWVFHRVGGGGRGAVIAAASTWLLGGSTVILAHMLNGTPAPFTSSAPSILVGTVFYPVYASRLLGVSRA